MLGHASAAMTLDRYSHLFDDVLETAADRLDEARQRTLVAPLVPPGRRHPADAGVNSALTCTFVGGPGRIRTCGTRFRKPLLYPLSYGAHAERHGTTTHASTADAERLSGALRNPGRPRLVGNE